jgi:hypothetical protein
MRKLNPKLRDDPGPYTPLFRAQITDALMQPLYDEKGNTDLRLKQVADIEVCLKASPWTACQGLMPIPQSAYLELIVEEDWPRAPVFEMLFRRIRALFPHTPAPRGELDPFLLSSLGLICLSPVPKFSGPCAMDSIAVERCKTNLEIHRAVLACKKTICAGTPGGNNVPEAYSVKPFPPRLRPLTMNPSRSKTLVTTSGSSSPATP